MNEKGPDCEYDKRNISVFICDTYTPHMLTNSWWRHLNVRSDDFNLTTRNPCFSSFLVSSNLYEENHDRNHDFWRIGTTNWIPYPWFLPSPAIYQFNHRGEIRWWGKSKYAKKAHVIMSNHWHIAFIHSHTLENEAQHSSSDRRWLHWWF